MTIPFIPSITVQTGEMNMLLLKKIEELTLYLIEQNNELEALKKENQAQAERLERLEKKSEQRRQK